MIESFKKESIAKGIFWFAFISEILVFAVKKFDLVLPYESTILRGLCLLFCIKILLTRYSKQEWLMIIVCGLLGVIGYFASGRGIDLFFRASMMVWAAKDISREKAFKVLLSILTITYGWNILQSLLGMKPMFVIDDFGRGITEKRYVFGFSHANTLHFSLWSLMTLFIYLYHKKMRPWHYAVLAGLAFALTCLTRSRTGGALTFLTLGLFFCFYYIPSVTRHKKLIFLAVSGILIFCLALSAFTVIYGPDPILWLNSLMTGRIALAYHGIIHVNPPFTLTLFSTQGRTLYIDMGFIRLIYSYGVIPALFYLAAILFLLWDDYRTENYTNLTFLTGLILLTLIEAQQVNCDIVYNFTLIMLFGRLHFPGNSTHLKCK